MVPGRASRSTDHSGVPAVNVVGYHDITSGLGEAARQLTRSLSAAGVRCLPVGVDLTNSPRRGGVGGQHVELADRTIAVVTASELPRVLDVLPEPFDTSRVVAGYWFWELSVMPDAHRPSLDLVDEIWVPTRFVHEAYDGHGTPCRVAPIRIDPPLTTPEHADGWRRRVCPSADTFLVLASCDLFSIPARKNPFGAIDAFARAFSRSAANDVRLVVKVLNGHALPDDLEAIRAAAAADPRITVVDDHLTDIEHYALIAAADCFVSLHRSEGLGLQLAAAMWLGTPVVATRYGGNLDFMDDSCARLVDATLCPVGDGRGAYPDDALWADPDVDEAADLLHGLARDPRERSEISRRARERMLGQPSNAEFGRHYWSVLEQMAGRGR
jgi:glycosyltransferase involved in cell wall biosynthesis